MVTSRQKLAKTEAISIEESEPSIQCNCDESPTKICKCTFLSHTGYRRSRRSPKVYLDAPDFRRFIHRCHWSESPTKVYDDWALSW